MQYLDPYTNDYLLPWICACNNMSLKALNLHQPEKVPPELESSVGKVYALKKPKTIDGLPNDLKLKILSYVKGNDALSPLSKMLFPFKSSTTLEDLPKELKLRICSHFGDNNISYLAIGPISRVLFPEDPTAGEEFYVKQFIIEKGPLKGSEICDANFESILPFWTDFELMSLTPSQWEIMKSKDLSHVRCLTLDKKCFDEITSIVDQLPNLTQMILHCQDILDEDLVRLAKFSPNLTKLELLACKKITNEGISSLISLEELHQFHITNLDAEISYAALECFYDKAHNYKRPASDWLIRNVSLGF